MKIVIDTNILLSAMIKESLTRNIIMNANMELYYPQIALSEVHKHKNIVIRKAGLDELEYERIFQIITEKLKLVKFSRIRSKVHQATKIIGKRDPNDVIFIATALSIPHSVIWSNDLDFKEQKDIEVFNTKELNHLITK
jgi:predicted nucleic acid-binding protein